MKKKIALIETQLDRLGVLRQESGFLYGTTGLICSDWPTLPAGWVEIMGFHPDKTAQSGAKHAGHYQEKADTILGFLTNLDVQGKPQSEEAFSNVLLSLKQAGFEESPASIAAWPPDLCTIEKLTSAILPDGITLITIQTNDGPRYTAGWHSDTNDLLCNALRSKLMRLSRKQAIDHCGIFPHQDNLSVDKATGKSCCVLCGHNIEAEEWCVKIRVNSRASPHFHPDCLGLIRDWVCLRGAIT